jgi:uncharacterized membrane protein
VIHDLLLPVHILAGIVALVVGYVALFAAKGGRLHKRTGRIFVYAMVVLGLLGSFLATIHPMGHPTNIVAGLVTFYLVSTGMRSAQKTWRPGRIDIVIAVLAFLFAVGAFRVGMGGTSDASPSIVFGIVALLGGIGDVRVLRNGGIDGRRRIARHVWRMCLGMFVGAASFFFGPRGRVPEFMYYPSLLPIPALMPIAMMVFWLVRLRVKKSFRGIVGNAVAQSSAAMEQMR